MNITSSSDEIGGMITFLGHGLKIRSANLKMSPYLIIYSFFALFLIGNPIKASTPGEIKVSFAFRKPGVIDCQMALTKDSVGVLAIDSSAGSLEPDDENGFAHAQKKRSLTLPEQELAASLLSLSQKWQGLKRYNCEKHDGYAFSLWADSLALHCNNCFSCTEGISVPEAKILARFGKLTMWLYQLSESIP
jgi:hypothetical protein